MLEFPQLLHCLIRLQLQDTLRRMLRCLCLRLLLLLRPCASPWLNLS